MSATTFPRRLRRPAEDSPDARRPAADRLRGFVRGDVGDPAWARPALLGLLALTTVAYLWNLTESGYANSFYAAAVQAGTRSWKAFFFGSLDSSSFITVDKPPAALWVMALSGRIFGFSSASMLVPQVLEGVAAVALLHATVKRWFGTAAGLLAGGLLAVTPVAALMFRFNNPDALLACLLVASAYCLVRALEQASTRWLLAVGTLLGFAFLTKMLQAFLVLPGFALVYTLAAPTTLRRRLAQLLAGGAAVLVSCGWWLAIVALWPVGSRPMIDGSPDNNIFNLIFGYNGLGRIFGSGGAGGGGGGANFSGTTGAVRLFNDAMGGQASWLLPAALLALVAGLWWTRRAPRTDRSRAGLMLWGGWLLVTAAVFSFSSGVIHTYYTVALAPAIAALVAIGTVLAWRERARLQARALLAAAVIATAGWSIVLLRRTPVWEPWLVPVIAVAGVAAVAALLMPSRFGGTRLGHAVAILAAVACLAGPVAYTVDTLSIAHTGSVPSAGPDSTAGAGLPGGFGEAAAPAAAAGFSRSSTELAGAGATGGDASTSTALIDALERGASRYRWVAATDGSQNAATLELASGGEPVMAIGGFNGQGGHLSLAQFERYVKAGDIHYYIASSGGGAGGAPGVSAIGGRAGARGDASGSTRVPLGAGAIPPPPEGGSASAGRPPAGLFGGSSSASTGGSAEAGRPPAAPGAGAGAGTAGGIPGDGYSDTAITKWVEAHFKEETIGGETVYNLTERS